MYAERPPPGDLAGHLRCTWTAVSGGPADVLPDGCLDLMWVDGELVVAGPDTTAMPSDVPAGSPLAAVRFRPGAATVVLGPPAVDLRDQRVPLDRLWPDAARLADRVGAAAGPAARVAVLESAVRDRLPAAPPLDPIARAVATALARAPGPPRDRRRPPAGPWAGGTGPREGGIVTGLAGRVGLSERQLHRRCLVAFGYGAKTLDRVLRLQRFLALRGTGPDLAGLAAAAGYADQAHLTRECRALAGTTPARLVRSVQDRAAASA